MMAVIALVCGGLLGLTYVGLLRLDVRLYLSQRIVAGIAVHVGRLTGVVLVFAIVAHVGAVDLLATVLGFTVVRFLSMRAEVRRCR